MTRGKAPGQVALPTKICPTCGDGFFTQVGLDEHVRLGLHDRLTRRWVGGVHPAQRRTGLQVAALNNARRRRCNDCPLTTTPAALGIHQKLIGHTGWTDVA